MKFTIKNTNYGHRLRIEYKNNSVLSLFYHYDTNEITFIRKPRTIIAGLKSIIDKYAKLQEDVNLLDFYITMNAISKEIESLPQEINSYVTIVYTSADKGEGYKIFKKLGTKKYEKYMYLSQEM